MNIIHKCILTLFLLCLSAGSLSAGQTPSFSLSGDNLVIDQKGRQIRIEKPFKRIISLYGAHTENLFYLGLDSEIIGVTRSDTFPEKALNKSVFSQRDDPEKFLAENPDLILIRPMLDRGYAKLFSRLEQSGITVVSIQPKHVDDMYLYWKILGALTGRTSEADSMVDTFKETAGGILSQTQQLEPKVQVYFEAIHKKMKTFTRGAMADYVLVTAGGINVASDGTPSRGTNIAIYGKERILSKADQIDVFLAQKGAMNHVTPDLIRNEPGFQIIKAVREDRIYIVDEKIVSRPTMRLLLGISEIGGILYPELSWEGMEQHIKELFE